MKIKPEHYAILKTKIEEAIPLINSHKEYLIKENKFKDFGTRLRFDIFYKVKAGGINNELYEYLDDTHINTALKKIFKELNIVDSLN
jgi:hypothetical protein